MRRKNSQKETLKTCPLLDEKCLKSGCEIYNKRLDQCEIGLTAYNLYLLSDVIRRQIEYANGPVS